MDYRAAFLMGAALFIGVGALMLVLSRLAPERDFRQNGEKGTAWTQLDIRYAVFALIFLSFDMEMIFMFPWAVAYRVVKMTAFWDALVFAGILAVGLIYAGKRGGFEL